MHKVAFSTDGFSKICYSKYVFHTEDGFLTVQRKNCFLSDNSGHLVIASVHAKCDYLENCVGMSSS